MAKTFWRINQRLSLDAALDQWKQQAAIGRRPKTVEYNERLCRQVRQHWSWDLATPCVDITPESVALFGAAVSHYSPSQFNHLVNLVRVLVPEAAFIRRKTERPKRVRLPSEERFAAMLAELDKGRSPAAGLVARLLAFTGLRIGEARAIRRRHILADGIEVEDSKTHEPRLVPWVGECRQIVDRLFALNPGSDVLVPCKSIRRALNGACARAEVSRLTHHDFRRLFATRCLESKVDVPTVSRWLGHKDGGALLGKTYFHLLASHSTTMARQVRILQLTE